MAIHTIDRSIMYLITAIRGGDISCARSMTSKWQHSKLVKVSLLKRMHHRDMIAYAGCHNTIDVKTGLHMIFPLFDKLLI